MSLSIFFYRIHFKFTKSKHTVQSWDTKCLTPKFAICSWHMIVNCGTSLVHHIQGFINIIALGNGLYASSRFWSRKKIHEHTTSCTSSTADGSLDNILVNNICSRELCIIYSTFKGEGGTKKMRKLLLGIRQHSWDFLNRIISTA